MRSVIACLCLLGSLPIFAKDTVVLHGKVADGNNQPRKSCVVEAKTPGFEAVATTTCTPKGEYRLELPKGFYNAIFICDENYKKSTLEFWAWNLELTNDFRMDVQFDTLEVYNLSVFNSKGGPRSMFIAFRPMSLAHFKKPTIRGFTPHRGVPGNLYDISPSIDIGNIHVTIDDKPVENEHLTWYYEKAMKPGEKKPTYLPACLLQIRRPSLGAGMHTLRVTIRDEHTGALGQALTRFKSNRKGFGF